MNIDFQLYLGFIEGLVLAAIGLAFAHLERHARERNASSGKSGKAKRLAHV